MRYILCVLIVLCAYMAGSAAAKSEKERLTTLSSARSFLRFILHRTEYTHDSVCEIFLHFRNETLERNGFLALLNSGGVRRMNERWTKATLLLGLPKRSEEAFLRLGEELGRLSYEEQRNRILLCDSILKTDEDELGSSLPSRTKCIRTVSTLAGLLAGILII